MCVALHHTVRCRPCAESTCRDRGEEEEQRGLYGFAVYNRRIIMARTATQNPCSRLYSATQLRSAPAACRLGVS